MMSATLASLASSIAHLRTIATPATDYRVVPFGIEAIDSRIVRHLPKAGRYEEATPQ